MSAKVALAYEAPPSVGVASQVVDAPPPDGLVHDLIEFAILPEAGDNSAIARTVTPAGTLLRVAPGAEPFALSHLVLEGHRFAVAHVSPGTHLTSWGLTFAEALVPIAPGQYLANERVLKALRGRGLTDLPATPNMRDLIVAHTLHGETFAPTAQVPLAPTAETATYPGFARDGARGVGTRNYVIMLATTAETSGFVKAVEARVGELGLLNAGAFPNVDGAVAVAHTEGAGFSREDGERPNNYELVLRTLTGFMCHPNVGAALVVEYGSNTEAVWGEDIKAFANAHGAPLDAVPHVFARLSGDFSADVAACVERVRALLTVANATRRTPQSCSTLSIAQQCGGSDAFSGVSGNPCAGEACKILIEHGGQAVLAETDELMGAESYILSKVKDLSTAQAFMGLINDFKERLAWHGQSAESNPSGGNNWRGLYNIGLKSLGAAKKKHADVSLDGVLRYGEPGSARGRGYYMMDSPGNDLESIAGQVACGCNIIYFVTGNGSITNFPFVPTIKIVTTTARFKLLEKDMDFNAGRYQEGLATMPALGKELYDLTVSCAGGQYSVGERAGVNGLNAQVSLWRNWNQTGPTDVSVFNYNALGMSGLGFSTTKDASIPPPVTASIYPTSSRLGGAAIDRIGLILPTSLCSGEVARKITLKLNAALEGVHPFSDGVPTPSSLTAIRARVSRFECLPHTEGCGTAYAEGGLAMYCRVMLGHLCHPSISLALCLEHGCEKTHNDFFSSALNDAGIDNKSFGYASIQLDGGIDAVVAKVMSYFSSHALADVNANKAGGVADRVAADVRGLDVGLVCTDKATAALPVVALMAAALAKAFYAGGGSLVVPASSHLLSSPLFADELTAPPASRNDPSACGPFAPTLAFGEAVRRKTVDGAATLHVGGVHLMDMPCVKDFSETVTGLAATGCHAVLVLNGPPKRGGPRPATGHPIIPVIHVGLQAQHGAVDASFAASMDASFSARAGESAAQTAVAWADGVLASLSAVASGTKKVKAGSNVFFNITRGHTGVST